MSDPRAIDHVDSFARQRGSEVELVLRGLADDVETVTSVVLAREGATVSAPAQARARGESWEVRARTPRRLLADGVWSIALVGGTHRTVEARLLVQGDRPLVLLLGATAPPSVVPRGPVHPGPDPFADLTARQRVARTGGRVLDAALSVLPAERAASARRRARSLARSVLG